MTPEQERLWEEFVANWEAHAEGSDPMRATILAAARNLARLRRALAALDSPELLELLADVEHARWSDWEIWRAKVAEPGIEASWKRQRETPYAELSEIEREADRAQARTSLAIIRKVIAP